jgi:GNAT superfamily N-acetyltransferase
MISQLSGADFQQIYNIVNEASVAYKGKIPADCYTEPYMPKEELQAEIEAGVQFYGTTVDGELAAVMGIQPVDDVTLIRHAYTLTRFQRQGLGEQLLNHLIGLAKTQRVLVGTWTDATWAIIFYQKHGFILHSREETNKLLNKYWHIPQRQIETSVVLEQWRNT